MRLPCGGNDGDGLGDFYACGCHFKRRLSFSWNLYVGHFASVRWNHFEYEPEHYDKFWSWTRLVYLLHSGLLDSAALTKHFGVLVMLITLTSREAMTLFLSFVLFDNV